MALGLRFWEVKEIGAHNSLGQIQTALDGDPFTGLLFRDLREKLKEIGQYRQGAEV
ncbi:MAG TPA: hypothetical protein VJ721_08970 [Chthoniobacterales bacterium]|nr:hypothetical protein [Chthoniobacterales bacterium]